MDSLEERIQAIEERNRRVEAEKAWELSWCRRCIILGITFITAFLFLSITDPFPPLHALIPTFGYLFSTLSLPWMKQQWIEHTYKLQAKR